MANRLTQHIRRQANLALADEYRLFLGKLSLQMRAPAVFERICSEPFFTWKVFCYLSICEVRFFSCPNNSINLQDNLGDKIRLR